MVVETEIRKVREEMKAGFDRILKVLAGNPSLGNWIKQDQACIMLGVSARQIRNLRIHTDKKKGHTVGCIRWRKGKGRTPQYHKKDLEKYLSEFTVG